MNKTVRWLGGCGLVIAVGLGLNACGATPTVQGQSDSVANTRTDQGSKLDDALLKQVDAAITAAKGRNEDVSAAQALRDSATELANKGLFEEANGNLKTAAMTAGVLADINGEKPQPAAKLPQAPKPESQLNAQGSQLLNVSFDKAKTTEGWELVGAKLPSGTPLWEVRDGLLVQRGIDGIDSSDEQTALVTGDAAWRDVTVAVEGLADGARELGVVARQQGANFYRFRAIVAGDDATTNNYILEKVVDGTATEIGNFPGAAVSTGNWHTLSLSATGSTISVAVDGKQLGSVEDSTLGAGRVGVSTMATSGAYFANLKVTGR